MASKSKDKRAKENGWLVLCPNEAYEMRIGRNSWIFILEENGKWQVWRGDWFKNKQGKPSREKTIIKGVKYDTALRRANSYVRYIYEQRRIKGA